MSTWTTSDLEFIDGRATVGISSWRADGGLRRPVPVALARVGNDAYVRSAYGPDNGWYRRALRRGSGRVEAGGRVWNVRYEHVSPDELALHAELDVVFKAKYVGYYGPQAAEQVIGAGPATTTLKLVNDGEVDRRGARR